MNSLVIIFFATFVAVGHSVTYLDRNLTPFAYRVVDSPLGRTQDEGVTVEGVYTYVDNLGRTHYVKYIAGTQIGFKVVEDNVIGQAGQPYFQTQSNFGQTGFTVPGVEVAEVVKVHHIRNEVPATVHKTTVPDIVYNLAAPPLLQRQKHA